MEKIYLIGGVRYVQEPIVLGQLSLLLPILSAMSIRTGDPAEIVSSLGDGLAGAIAVVLLEEGRSPREACSVEALEARTRELEWAMTPETALEVVEDFLACNRILSLSARIRERMDRMIASAEPITSNASATPCVEETSSSATPSSGE